jgi:hypothetical protein
LSRFLPVFLILAGAGVMSIALGANLLIVSGPPGIGPKQFSLAFCGFVTLLAGVILISSINWRYIAEWLLVVTAVVAVAFAADLLVVNGLPQFGAKYLVLAATGLGGLLTVIVPAAPANQWQISAWLKPLALDRLAIGKFLSVTLQLGLLVLVVQQFHLENQAFYSNLLLLTFYGFLVHYFLPTRYRQSFFFLLSLAAMVGILGVANSLWLIAIGLGLIGICHLPIRHTARVVILLAVGALLVVLRGGSLPAPGLEVIWPILGSMFMFRLIIYVYDLKHSKAVPTLSSTLAYFFLLPNVVFPFFPVVDYSTFRRTYYDEEQHQIYQKGVQWILRGVVQLILYRLINYYLIITPAEVTNAPELVRYLILNYGVYIRISGQFHVIIGILHLFGFNLPTTHHLYFLAESFTDLWRRINIYWKDFMLKVFYYPTFFRIRQWGPVASLGVATLFVFFLTWFFHAYQWFWLRGTFLLTGPDVFFWSVLAILVVVNTLREAQRGRKRTLEKRAMSLREIAARALRAASTFTVMAILWALWSSASIRDWLGLLAVVDLSWNSLAVLGLTFLAITLVLGVAIWIGGRNEASARPKVSTPAFFRTSAVTGGAALLLCLVSNPVVYSQFGGNARALVSDLTVNRLSSREAALLQQGYYEDLIDVNRFNSELWEIYTKRPTDWPNLNETPAARQTGDNFIVELVPSTTISFHGTRMSINRWGMRDRDYELTPAPGTFRIAMTGPSFVMGYGVEDDEGFEVLLEDRLNREQAGRRYASYEILDFAVPGYSAIQDLLVLEQKALPFQPNALFFMSHQREEEAIVLYLADRVSVGAELPYPELVELIRQAGAEPGMTKIEAERHLKPYGTELLSWTFRHIVEVSQAHGIVPVWIFMPTLEEALNAAEAARLEALAEQAGFIVLDLSAAYKNQDLDSLVVAYWDKHPNAKGHQLIAARLYADLLENKDKIPLFE